MSPNSKTDSFYVKYNLGVERGRGTPKQPVNHQQRAITDLTRWYKADNQPHAGKLLVIPTGGGKTYTAAQFLGASPLSDGYKLLWMAHTHHLLEQAFYALEDCLARIQEPRPTLAVRVVSGQRDHFKTDEILTGDDVIIATLQTITRAYRDKRRQLRAWLDSADGRLAVVFDEAHHAPANTYRRLLQALIEEQERIVVLGLTATPTYTNEEKRGWLKKLFPQGLCQPSNASKLMSEGILSRPKTITKQTKIQQTIPEIEYERMVKSNTDLPESVIWLLADNQQRNNFIVDDYVRNKDEYGKTIMFVDRWPQCEHLEEKLKEKGVRVDSVYSHVSRDSNETRQSRDPGDNARAIKRFKENELDVLINIRMLTEGTDVPDAKTVFCTRQTTSSILLQQMVGRALRGPRFGGTSEANLVFFIDNWQQHINFADYENLTEGLADDSDVEYEKRPPLQLISIELVRRLVRQMDGELKIAPGPFLEMLPVGWYVGRYEQVDNDDTVPVQKMILVFSHERESYVKLIKELEDGYGRRFSDSDKGRSERFEPLLTELRERCFPDHQGHTGSELLQDIFDIGAHWEQQGQAPTFFPFEDREKHDLDQVAKDFIDRDLGSRAIDAQLGELYDNSDYYWRSLYYTRRDFKHQFDLCKIRLLEAEEVGADSNDYRPAVIESAVPREREAPPEVKAQVKDRDGRSCLCCGVKRGLQVDHIQPLIHEGQNSPDNLQTLCKKCNSLKGEKHINFCRNNSTLPSPPESLPRFNFPGKFLNEPTAGWEAFVRYFFNFFYRCAAVKSVKIHQTPGSRNYADWVVELYEENKPEWLEPFGQIIMQSINEYREGCGQNTLQSITIKTPRESVVLRG